ncbi:MFS transporter [Bailinhaonella thermotolerans]|uniref:MFS transporter n=1 Tax=Bailinhaonella thermotolerans TaxID=1070861 RepID=A0A3A4ATC7_9ACTN|nr:MFS transporter [Bailinhaonella thermotolerans]RJL33230.1 MFS transporter [Bailinhaonella thermotolerans]
MRTYLDFLRTPHAARLLGGTLLGRLPNGMGPLAIVLYTRAHGGSYALAGALSALYGLAMAAGQPVLGRIMDRYGQPRILLPSALLALAGFAVLALTGVDALPLVVAATLVAGLATPPLEAGLRALWPLVLEPARVRAAYALDAAAQELLFTVGPLIVVAAAVVSEEAALLLTGALGLAGTLVVVTSRHSRAWRGEPRAADWAGPLRSPGLRVLLTSLTFVGVALGVFSVAVVVYADERGIESASGVLLAAMSAGALIGGLVYGARPRPMAADRQLTLLLCALAAGYVPVALAPAMPLMTMFALVSGVFLAPVLACGFTVVDVLAPRGTVTEAFAWIVTAVGAGGALGMALAGVAANAGGVHASFAVSAVAGLLATLVLAAGRRTLTPAAVPAP